MERGYKREASRTKRQQTKQRRWFRFVEKVKRDIKERHTPKEKESAADRAARLTANATRAIAWLTLFIAVIAGLQLYELFEGGADTTAIAKAAKQQARSARQIAKASRRNATAAEGFATSAGLINGGINDAVSKLGAQSKAIEAARRSSIDSSSKALQATIDNFHQEQRAWVGITQLNSIVDKSVNPEQVLDAKGRGTPAIQEMFGVTNTGRVPAQDVRLESCLYRREKNYVPGILDAQWMQRIIDARVNGTLQGVSFIDGRAQQPSTILSTKFSWVLTPLKQRSPLRCQHLASLRTLEPKFSLVRSPTQTCSRRKKE